MATLEITSDNRIKIRCSYDERELAKKIPDYRWNNEEKCWYYPFSEERLMLVKQYFPTITTTQSPKKLERTKQEEELIALKNQTACEIELPALKHELRDYQKVGVEYLLSLDAAMLADQMGCLSGETEVKINRGGGCRTYTIADAYHRFHNTWDKKIISKIRSEQKGFLYLNDIVDIVYRGKKQTFCLQTKTKRIYATSDHEFLTLKGYKKISQLHINDIILVNGLKYCPICKKYTEHALSKTSKFFGKCRVCIYRFYRKNSKFKNGESLTKDGYVVITAGMCYYPYGRRDYASDKGRVTHVLKHRLVLEAKLNNLTYKQWWKIIRYNAFTKKHKFLPKGINVHHKDGNPLNNSLLNLQIVSNKEHPLLHDPVIHFGGFIPKQEKIISIKKHKIEDVYDIKMKAPYHNFVANGFIVHNCGKSLASIATSLVRKQRREIKKTVVICPATAKYSTWEKEIKKFTNEQYLVVDGDKKKREEIYHNFLERDDVHFLIINYESLIGDIHHLKRLPFESQCIADESIYIKNRKAKRTKAVKSIKSKYKIAISGYPVGNKIQDIHSQFDWLMPGFLGSFWAFQDRYCDFLELKKNHTEETKETGKNCKCKICGKWSPEQKYAFIYTCKCINPEWEEPKFKKLLGYKNLDELKFKIEPYFIRRLKKDVLKDLPEKVYERRDIELSGDVLKAYNEMKEDMRLTIKNMRDEEVTSKANNIMVQMLRLSQLTCGFITDAEWKHPIFYDRNPKVDALDEIIDEVLSNGDKIVVWTRFRAFLAHLYKRYSEGYTYDKEHKKHKCTYIWGGMTPKAKDANIKMFQEDPECQIIFGTVQTGGISIDLYAASVEVFTDLSFLSPSTVEQATDRLHRLGQKKTVVVIDEIARKTVDEHWVNILNNKQKASGMLFDDDGIVRINDKETFLKLLE